MRNRAPLIAILIVLLGLAGVLITYAAGGFAATTQGRPVADEPAEERLYIGTANESRGLIIAVAVSGTEATGYVCDGSDIAEWLKGTVVNGSLTLENGSISLTAAVTGDGLADGEGNLQGRPFTFSLDPAGEQAGLYRGIIGEAVLGWIVRADGTQIGAVASPDGAGRAPQLDIERGQVEIGGQQVDVVRVTGATTF